MNTMKVALTMSVLILAFALLIIVALKFFTPVSQPSDAGVYRLVDTQYNIVCYYSRIAVSCVPLKP